MAALRDTALKVLLPAFCEPHRAGAGFGNFSDSGAVRARQHFFAEPCESRRGRRSLARFPQNAAGVFGLTACAHLGIRNRL